MVEKASILFISVWVQAITAAKIEENPPIIATTSNAFGATMAKIGNSLATKNTPATTMVAA